MTVKVDNHNSPSPKKVYQVDPKTLGITWTDGLDAHYDVKKLRIKCPCAQCIDEWTGERRLDPNAISDTVQPVKLNNVGLYAIQIFWSDGHDTGLYSHDYLRQITEDCVPG